MIMQPSIIPYNHSTHFPFFTHTIFLEGESVSLPDTYFHLHFHNLAG